MFPLKVGNEFYYNYKYTMEDYRIYISGTETWKILSSINQRDFVSYTIERKLNANSLINGHSALISDSIRYIKINEYKSGLISLKLLDSTGVNFNRYQKESEIILVSKKRETAGDPSWSYKFVADSGLTYYQYYRPPNSVIRHSLKLDSVKIIH